MVVAFASLQLSVVIDPWRSFAVPEGKHHIRIVQVVSDEEYALSRQVYPGMDKHWRNGVLRALRAKESVTQAEREAIESILGEDGILGSDKFIENNVAQTPEIDTVETPEALPKTKKEESSGSV